MFFIIYKCTQICAVFVFHVKSHILNCFLSLTGLLLYFSKFNFAILSLFFIYKSKIKWLIFYCAGYITCWLYMVYKYTMLMEWCVTINSLLTLSFLSDWWIVSLVAALQFGHVLSCPDGFLGGVECCTIVSPSSLFSSKFARSEPITKRHSPTCYKYNPHRKKTTILVQISVSRTSLMAAKMILP